MATQSWQLLSTGSGHDFVAALKNEVFEHPGVKHPYLKRLSTGDFPDMTWALRDFAFQYAYYSREFTSYLEAVLGGIRSLEDRQTIEENLLEEKGEIPTPGGDEAIPHRILFQQFREALGVTPEFERTHEPCTTVLVWRDLFLQKCHSRQEGVGIGAIGLGTEFVVPTIYRNVLEAVEKFSPLTPRQRLFLTLHAYCDEEHGAELVTITEKLAERVENREAIRFGVNSALNLRAAFWDVMLARASVPPKPSMPPPR